MAIVCDGRVCLLSHQLFANNSNFKKMFFKFTFVSEHLKFKLLYSTIVELFRRGYLFKKYWVSLLKQLMLKFTRDSSISIFFVLFDKYSVWQANSFFIVKQKCKFHGGRIHDRRISPSVTMYGIHKIKYVNVIWTLIVVSLNSQLNLIWLYWKTHDNPHG